MGNFRLLITSAMRRNILYFLEDCGCSWCQRAKLVDWRTLKNADRVYIANTLSYLLFSIFFIIISSLFLVRMLTQTKGLLYSWLSLFPVVSQSKVAPLGLHLHSVMACSLWRHLWGVGRLALHQSNMNKSGDLLLFHIRVIRESGRLTLVFRKGTELVREVGRTLPYYPVIPLRSCDRPHPPWPAQPKTETPWCLQKLLPALLWMRKFSHPRKSPLLSVCHSWTLKPTWAW